VRVLCSGDRKGQAEPGVQKEELGLLEDFGESGMGPRGDTMELDFMCSVVILRSPAGGGSEEVGRQLVLRAGMWLGCRVKRSSRQVRGH
jgi:hypothetical protein